MKHLGSVDIVSGFTPCQTGVTCMSHRNRIRRNLPLMKVVNGSQVIVSTYQLRSCLSILTLIFLSIYFILSEILVLSLLIFATSYSFRYPRLVKNRTSLLPPHLIHIIFSYISDMSSHFDYSTDLKLTELLNFCFYLSPHNILQERQHIQ